MDYLRLVDHFIKKYNRYAAWIDHFHGLDGSDYLP